jgi:hypothetical protein
MDSGLQLLARHLNSVLVGDKTASAPLRHMYHNNASIYEALLHFPVQFAPGLVDMLESPQALDLYCEDSPKGYNTKHPGHLKTHNKTCPAHQIRGLTPDLYCENCPKGYSSKHPTTLKTHKKTCPAHKG